MNPKAGGSSDNPRMSGLPADITQLHGTAGVTGTQQEVTPEEAGQKSASAELKRRLKQRARNNACRIEERLAQKARDQSKVNPGRPFLDFS